MADNVNVIQYATGLNFMGLNHVQINFIELNELKEHNGIFTLGYTRFHVENKPVIEHIVIGAENTYVIWNGIKYETKEDFQKLYLEIEKRNMEKLLDNLP